MTGTVTLPIWLFIVLLVLALWALLERLLVPGVRWYLRRKGNRAIREINTRLNVQSPQVQLARRAAPATRARLSRHSTPISTSARATA